MSRLQHSSKLRWTLTAFGALTMPWAFPRTGFGWLAVVGIAGLVIAVYRERVAAAARMGLIFGFVWAVVSLRWADVISTVAWIGLSAIVAVWMALFAGATAAVTRRRWWLLAVPTLWVAVEQLRCLVPWGGFPWLRLSFVGGIEPLLPAAWLLSIAGVSWLLAAFASALAYAVIVGPSARMFAPIAVVAVAATLLTTSSVLVQNRGAKQSVIVGYVQPSQTASEIDDRSQRTQLLNDTIVGLADVGRQVAALRATGKQIPAVIALAEDALPGSVWAGGADTKALSGAVDIADAAVLAGFVIWSEDRRNLLNRAALWQPGVGPGEQAGDIQFYDKRHLVPFGEWVPFREITESWVSEIALVSSDFVSGTKPGRFVTGTGITVGTVICFETAFDDVTRDVIASDVLTVQTNNSAFLGTEQPAQQFAISQARAAEAGRPLVVAAATGVSGVINARGRVVTGSLTADNIRQSAAFVMDAGGYRAPAFIAGPLLRWGSVVLSALMLLGWAWARRRKVDGELAAEQ